VTTKGWLPTAGQGPLPLAVAPTRLGPAQSPNGAIPLNQTWAGLCAVKLELEAAAVTISKLILSATARGGASENTRKHDGEEQVSSSHWHRS